MNPSGATAIEPGVYKIQENCTFGQFSGDVVGTVDGSYNIYVDDKDQSEHFRITNPPRKYFAFNPEKGLKIAGNVFESIVDPKITYSIVMPGVVMDEGTLEIVNKQNG